MSRKIKYRVWNIPFKKWEKNICPRQDGRPIDIDGYCWQNIESFRDNFVFQQFTGLSDKNGVQIYEGDIVKFYHGILDYENGQLEIKKASEDIFAIKCDLISGCFELQERFSGPGGELEVVGNIFENSELLTK